MKNSTTQENTANPPKRSPGRPPKGKTWDPQKGYIPIDDNCSEYFPSFFDDDTISNHD